jgi:cold shock CspA family protein
MINEDKGSDFVRPDDGGNEGFFHISALREGWWRSKSEPIRNRGRARPSSPI